MKVKAIKGIVVCRVSTKDQADDERFSLGVQKKRILEYIEAIGFEIIGEIREIIESAHKGKRQKFMKVLKEIQKLDEPVALFLYDISRFSRDSTGEVMTETDKLRREGKVELHFIYDNIVIHQNSRVTEEDRWKTEVQRHWYDSARKSERVKEVIDYKLQKGEFPSVAPGGYLNIIEGFKSGEIHKKIIIDPERGELVKEVFQDYAEDTYSLEELQKYPVLALYDIKWRNWEKTQKLLRDYLEAGGSIIFDASGNMGEIQYSLSETVFFGKMIERVEAEKNAIIEVVNPSLQGITVNPGEFINENGSSWYGTIYTSLENIDKFDEEILATIDGRPLIIKQKIGKGNLFWFSSNFIWHAFLNENMSELNLIKKTFDIAYDSSMGNN